MIKLPEPVGYMPYPVDEKGYTEAQLKQAVRDALEEAAKVCEKQLETGAHIRCAKAIRALIKEIV